MRTLLPLVLIACNSQPLPDSHSVQLKLINPTAANPMGGVDQLRLSIWDASELVYEETVDASEALELPNVNQYGVLRFELAGLNEEGAVLSYGRSSEIAVVPDVEREVAITFLPVNKVLTLGAEFLESRSFHSTAEAPDGRVYLIGGVNASQTGSLNSVEYYEPEAGRAIPLANFLSFSTVLPSVAWTDDERLLVHGGLSVQDGSFSNVAAANQINAATDMVSELPPTQMGHRDHCFHSFDGARLVATGGTSTAVQNASFLTPSPTHPSGWMWQTVSTDFQTYNIQSCGMIGDGRIFLQGTNYLSTGAFIPDPTGGSAHGFQIIDYLQSPLEYLVYPYGQMVIPLDDSRVWMAGGRQNLDGDGNLGNDPPAGVTREFNLDTMVFSQGADPNLSERTWGYWDPWIEADTYAVACGGVDGNVEANPNTLVEIFNLATQEVLLAASLDRNRPGCNMNVLDDGTILITGGHAEGDAITDGGAILVPYFD